MLHVTKRAVATLAVIAAVVAALALVAGCAKSASGSSPDISAAASSAKAEGASITANPTTAADLARAKTLVKSCFAGTPLEQAHQVRLVFLSSATGKNGPAVVAARDKLAGCLGISKADEKPFFNDAITAAEQAGIHKLLTSHDTRVTYLTVTLPGLVLKYSSAGYTPPASPGAGSVPGASPSPVTSGASS